MDIVKMFLGTGGVPVADGGPTALALAAAGGHRDIFSLLWHSRDPIGWKSTDECLHALEGAIKNHHIDMVELLLNLMGPGGISWSMYKLLVTLALASRYGHTAIVQGILDYAGTATHCIGQMSPSDSCRIEARKTLPLAEAAANGELEIVKLFIETHGADVNRYALPSPLKVAALNGHIDIVEYLLDSGAQINTGGDRRMTSQESALFYAATNGHLDVVQLLLQRGATVYDKTLDAAVENGHVDIAKLLVTAKPDIYGHYDYLVEAARNGGNTTEIRLLLDNEEAYGTSIASNSRITGVKTLLAAISAGDTSRVSRLLELGVPLEDGRSNLYRDTTPLLHAVKHRDIDIVNLLIQGGADVEALSKEQKRPLQVAAELGYIEIVKLLLDTGKANKHGETLSSAATGGHIGIVKLLLERHSDANPRDKNGNNIALAGARGRSQERKHQHYQNATGL